MQDSREKFLVSGRVSHCRGAKELTALVLGNERRGVSSAFINTLPMALSWCLMAAVHRGPLRAPPPSASFFDSLKKAAGDFDEAVWDAFQGRKERIWSPDRRPPDQRGPFDFSQSTLSWGREGCDIDSENPVKGCAEITDEVAASLLALAEMPVDSVSYESDMALLGDGRGGLAGLARGRAAMYAQVPSNPEARATRGRELAELCFAKYGRYHDMTLLRNKIFDGQWQVAFNIYGPCLGQRSFSYTENQYLEKLDVAAMMLNSWDQAWFVKGNSRLPFFLLPNFIILFTLHFFFFQNFWSNPSNRVLVCRLVHVLTPQ